MSLAPGALGEPMWGWGLVPFLVSAVLTASCAALLARRRSQPGAASFAFVLSMQTLWSLGYMGELAASSLEGKLFWDNVQLVAWLAMLPATLLCAWSYCERGPSQHHVVLGLYMVIPAMVAAWVLTDPVHGLARASARVEPAPPYGALLYEFTGIEVLAIVQTYLSLFYASVLLVRSAAQQHRAYRFQVAVMLFGLWLPGLIGTVGLLGHRLLGQRDIAPACFGLAAVPVTWALSRGRFFDFAPVARHVVFEQLPDPVLVLDAQERVVDLNPSAHALLAGDAGVIGATLSDLIDPENERVLCSLPAGAQIELSLQGRLYEARLEPLTRRRHPLAGRILLLRDITAQKRAEQGVFRAQEALEQRVAERTRSLHAANAAMKAEIAERERAELAARDSERRFRALFDGAAQMIATLAPDGTLIDANRTALEFAGVQASDVIGKPVWLGPWWQRTPDLQAKVRDAVLRAAQGEWVQLDLSHEDRAGAERHLSFSIKPVGLPDDRSRILLLEGRDLTERRRAEEERALLREQLHHSQKLDSIGRLAGGIAHDFNNLLTVILGQLDLALMALRRDKDPTESILSAVQAGNSAAGLTRQLLAFARKQPAEPQVLLINQVVDQTHRMLRRVIGEDVTLVLGLSPEAGAIRVDQGQLEQILLNLAVNARDAMPHGGTLTITTQNTSVEAGTLASHGVYAGQRTFVKLRVEDTGMGMPPEVVAHIFEPFFTTKEAGKGTGIGLSTVYGVVKQAGGFVQVASKPGEGTSFDMYFPATDAKREPLRPVSQDVPTGHERVALVEDQPAIRKLASDQLSRLGYDVLSFPTAEDALITLSKQLPQLDLLVTDVVLAGMNGPTLVELLRKARADLKVLYVSGYTDDAVLARGLDADAARLLHKPFSIRELAQAVRGVMDGEA